MIDTHCHVDLYANPSEVAARADRAGVLTVIFTNLPSALEKAYPHIRSFRKMRLSLGLHPLLAEQHIREKARFRALIDRTSIIGEFVLDFSPAGYATKDLQIESFRFVL